MGIKERQYWRDFNILVDGIGNLGVSKKLETPKIEFQTGERDGAMAQKDVIALIKALSAKITLNEYNAEAFTATSKQFGTAPTFVCKGSMTQGVSILPVLIMLKGRVEVLDTPIPDRSKEVEMTLDIAVTAYSLEINGVKKIDIDVDNMICIIDGVDLYTELRNHIQ
ncbi:phage major tail tube protein [Sulfuricurvum sp.]|uniref:phage major tail tube protein n=1 Tax=Sulfuricurvum sp. TaxID=2025608 RepID=UPI00261007AD|nr:phage major tail tube protein [Sulfuricurvum sp.]MDD2267009.1 phage major tail tube protein [Sulfuricurvum sp.]MDD2782625.1 phage major tail tube protein [Sulfuricurvum sp.]